jgi:hypothetical protein
MHNPVIGKYHPVRIQGKLGWKQNEILGQYLMLGGKGGADNVDERQGCRHRKQDKQQEVDRVEYPASDRTVFHMEQLLSI